MGYHTSYIKNCPCVLRKLTVLLQQVWKKGIVPQEWCLAEGIWISKEMQTKGITNFHPISLLNLKKIFFGVLAQYMTTFLMRNRYINTSIQKAGIPGFHRCQEHSQMIWNSILSAKRDKTELHVIWLDLANAYSSVPHHLTQMAPDFFNFPSKVGEIMMKYFNSAFMKFIAEDYTTKWQALEIGIMMNCVISPLLSGHGSHITRYSKYVERSDEKLTSDSSSFQSFYGRCHHSHPIQNRCRWFTTKVTFSHERE